MPFLIIAHNGNITGYYVDWQPGVIHASRKSNSSFAPQGGATRPMQTNADVIHIGTKPGLITLGLFNENTSTYLPHAFIRDNMA